MDVQPTKCRTHSYFNVMQLCNTDSMLNFFKKMKIMMMMMKTKKCDSTIKVSSMQYGKCVTRIFRYAARRQIKWEKRYKWI